MVRRTGACDEAWPLHGLLPCVEHPLFPLATVKEQLLLASDFAERGRGCPSDRRHVAAHRQKIYCVVQWVGHR